jgi:hypothetical protein
VNAGRAPQNSRESQTETINSTGALNLNTDESNRTNASLEMLFREQQDPFKISSKEKRVKPFLT